MLRKLDHATASATHPQEEAGSKLRLAPPIVHDVLADPGKALDAQTRARFEPALGHNFSHVRVHDDSRAAHSADAVDALAYTVGEHIVLGGRIPSPDRTMAHELAHVVQQHGSGGSRQPLLIDDANSPSESAARDAAHAALSGRNIRVGGQHAFPNPAAVRRQPKPDAAPTQTGGQGTPPTTDDDPTAWLTLQGQGLGQYQYLFTIPRPPRWMLGAQLAANFQFHAGKTGFELGVLGQYGHIFHQSVAATGVSPSDPRYGTATGHGDQGQIAIQPAWVFFSTGRTQIALIGQAGYAGTSSKDPGVAGSQFSLLAGAQITRDLPIPLGPLKAQVVGSLAGGGVWSKGPLDDRFAGAGAVQVGVGVQFAWDAVGRKKLRPPPPEHVEVKVPDDEQQKKPEDTKKDPDAEKKKADDAKKVDEAKKKVDEDPNKPADKGPKPPPPWDGKIFFLKDKPLIGIPDDKNVLDAGTGGEDLKDFKARMQTALAADPTLKIAILGSASIEAPTPKYNCDLGSRRAEWLRRQLGLSTAQIADPADKSVIAGNCEDVAGLVSFGSTKAVDTKDEDKRRADRYAIVHFHHL